MMMRRWSAKVLLCATVWVAAGAACRGQETAADEQGLWLVWAGHTNAATNPAAFAEACRTFKTKSPGDPLAVVVRGLEAWHLLKARQTNEAVRLLVTMITPSNDALPKAGADLARGWLTRLDRELVRAALMRVYVRDVAFPASLEAIKALKGVAPPPFTDRWGDPWLYQLAEMRALKGFPRQRYVLEAKRLGANSDLTQALAVPYASRIQLEPVRIVTGLGAGETVEFVTPARKNIALMAGTDMDGIIFAYLGKSLIVLTDGDHWRVVPRPR